MLDRAVERNYGGGADKIRFVRVGTLDEPERLPPVHEYCSSAKYWPAASLERRKTALG